MPIKSKKHPLYKENPDDAPYYIRESDGKRFRVEVVFNSKFLSVVSDDGERLYEMRCVEHLGYDSTKQYQECYYFRKGDKRWVYREDLISLR